MLSKIEIKGLYGLYSYSLDFRPERKPYCFVTGPNAYGKTSLLRMIDSLYNQNFKELSSIHFDGFDLRFDDDFQINVKQDRIYDDDSSSDETLPQKVVLNFTFGTCGITDVPFMWKSDTEEEVKLNNMTAYLASHPIYLITDNRLYKGVASKSVGQNLEGNMRTYLQDLERELNATIQQGMLDEQVTITESYYNEKVTQLQPYIDSILKYELVRRNPVPSYSDEKSAFCHTCITALENALTDKVLSKIACLDALCQIIENYGFAKKHLELSPYFGFRFKAEDEMASILSFDQLSSGERHIMLMNYDILFDVKDEALVLIDEPELSFHLEWQGQFMPNLDEIVRVRKDLQFIICTHAPEVFGYEWGVSVDLLEQSEEGQKETKR